MKRTKTPLNVLREIRAKDPEGDGAKYGIDELNAFEEWIVEAHGFDALTDYYTDWDTPSDPV